VTSSRWKKLRARAAQEKMDEAFRDAMQRAIRAGLEFVPTVVSTEPGTRMPKVALAL
jgi:hypothetical protein